MTDRRARNRGRKGSPRRTELVEGSPLPVEGRQLVPLVRVTSIVHRRASLGCQGVSGWGYGFAHMRPVAILEKEGDGERRHPIHNQTVRVLGWLALIALLMPGLTFLLVPLVRRLSARGSQLPPA